MDQLMIALKWAIIVTIINVNIIVLIKFLLGEPMIKDFDKIFRRKKKD